MIVGISVEHFKCVFNTCLKLVQVSIQLLNSFSRLKFAILGKLRWER